MQGVAHNIRPALSRSCAGVIRQYSVAKLAAAKGTGGSAYDSLPKITADVDLLFPVTENARRRMIRRLHARDAQRVTGSGASGGGLLGMLRGGSAGDSAQGQVQVPGPLEAGGANIASHVGQGSAAEGNGAAAPLDANGSTDAAPSQSAGPTNGKQVSPRAGGDKAHVAPSHASHIDSMGDEVPEWLQVRAPSAMQHKESCDAMQDVDERDEFGDKAFWQEAFQDVELPPDASQAL